MRVTLKLRSFDRDGVAVTSGHVPAGRADMQMFRSHPGKIGRQGASTSACQRPLPLTFSQRLARGAQEVSARVLTTRRAKAETPLPGDRRLHKRRGEQIAVRVVASSGDAACTERGA